MRLLQWAERRVSSPTLGDMVWRRHLLGSAEPCTDLAVDLVLPLLDGEHSPKGMDQNRGGRVRTDRAASG